ncbi:MAG: hypothetical protein IJX08_02040 [Clostridia bacterium]|nr:hypothetical protein [Clostridia bacterium]
MNKICIEKMEELLTNEDFAAKIEEAGSYENAHKLFVENGVDVSYEEFSSFIRQSGDAMKAHGYVSEDGELSAELLELVSGGGIGGKVAAIFTWVGAGVAYSVCPPAGVALWLLGGALWGQ